MATKKTAAKAAAASITPLADVLPMADGDKKYLDNEGLAYLINKIDGRYERQVEGKGLSTNDFTDEYKQIIDDLSYTKIAFTAGSATNSSNEIGATVTNTTVTWGLNKEPTTQKIKFSTEAEEELETSVRSKAYTGKNVTSNINIVITATDEREASVSRTVQIRFQPKVYWGTTTKETLENADVLALEGSALASSRAKTFSVNAEAGEKIVYAIPSSFGEATFNVGGFDGGFVKSQTFDFTNASGYEQSYDIYQSVQPGLGQTSVTVK